MSTRNENRDPAALAALRHLTDFGFLGWHLKQQKDPRPAASAAATEGDRFERQVVQADHLAAEGFPAHHNSAVFLLQGEPCPQKGDGLIALTRHWTIKGVKVTHRNGVDSIYAVLCV